MLHGTVHRLTKIYEQFGQCFPPYERYEAGTAQGKVLLCPPSVAGSAMLRNLGRTRLAVLTGWAVDQNCRYRYQAHAAFPLSDHADFPDLLEMVKQVKPRQVYTLHGFAADFAQTLREIGYQAYALSEDEQLALPLSLTPGARSTRSLAVVPVKGLITSTLKEALNDPASSAEPLRQVTSSSFDAFARACASIARTAKKLEKTALLATYIKGLEEPE